MFYELIGLMFTPHLAAIGPTCLQSVNPHEKFIIRLPSNISPPSDTLLGLFWSHIEIFWFISHSAHLAGELWNSIQDQHWDLQLLNVSILVRLCSQLWVYFSRLLDPWLHWPDTWGVQWINQRHTTPELRYGQTINTKCVLSKQNKQRRWASVSLLILTSMDKVFLFLKMFDLFNPELFLVKYFLDSG